MSIQGKQDENQGNEMAIDYWKPGREEDEVGKERRREERWEREKKCRESPGSLFLLFGIPLHPESVINKKKRKPYICTGEFGKLIINMIVGRVGERWPDRRGELDMISNKIRFLQTSHRVRPLRRFPGSAGPSRNPRNGLHPWSPEPEPEPEPS